MKEKRNRIVSCVLILMMFFSMIFSSQKVLAANKIEISVPNEVEIYAKNKYLDAVDVVRLYSNYYNVTEEQLNDIHLGQPFVIYEIDETEQDEIYYFPLLDSNGNTILLMSIMGTTEGWSMSISEEWVDELEDIGDNTSEYIFYKSEDNVYAESEKSELCIAGEVDDDIENFKEKDYEEKQEIIDDATDNFVKTDVNISVQGVQTR